MPRFMAKLHIVAGRPVSIHRRFYESAAPWREQNHGEYAMKCAFKINLRDSIDDTFLRTYVSSVPH